MIFIFIRINIDIILTNPVVGDEARKGFLRTAVLGRIMGGGSALLTQASPPYRPHSHLQILSGGLDLAPSPLFLFRQCGLT